MTIRTVYVRAKSKADLNRKLAANMPLGAGEAIEYTPYTEQRFALRDLPHGTVIKIYDKFVGGRPYAKAYGQWDSRKQRVR